MLHNKREFSMTCVRDFRGATKLYRAGDPYPIKAQVFTLSNIDNLNGTIRGAVAYHLRQAGVPEVAIQTQLKNVSFASGFESVPHLRYAAIILSEAIRYAMYTPEIIGNFFDTPEGAQAGTAEHEAAQEIIMRNLKVVEEVRDFCLENPTSNIPAAVPKAPAARKTKKKCSTSKSGPAPSAPS